MPVTRKKPPSPRQKPAKRETADFGPEPPIQRGEVVVGLAADPAAPNATIRRARRVWLPDIWLANGTIGQAEHDAATQLLRDYELGVMLATDRPWVRLGPAASGPSSGLTHQQLEAVGRYREAIKAVGPRLSGAIACCVLSYWSVKQFAKQTNMHHIQAAGYVLAALQRLADYYQRAQKTS